MIMVSIVMSRHVLIDRVEARNCALSLRHARNVAELKHQGRVQHQQDVLCDASLPSSLVIRANTAVKTSVDMLTVMQGSWEVRATHRLTQGSRLMLRDFFGQNALMVAQINVAELALD